MLDARLLRPPQLEHTLLQLKRRMPDFDPTPLLALEQARRVQLQHTEQLQQNHRQRSKNSAHATEDRQQQIVAATQLKKEKAELNRIEQAFRRCLLELPNLLDAQVPEGQDESSNQELRRVGEPRQSDFPMRDHSTVGQGIGVLDFEAASRISGARFVVLGGPLARLHRALAQFMLDTHSSRHNYQERYVPYLVNQESVEGTGQLPKFATDLFHCEGPQNRPLYLIPTAEVPLTNLLRQQIVTADQLPLRFVAHSPCFRLEAGSYGQDNRGMLRQHQFDKVELVQLVAADAAETALEEMTGHAEYILQALQLPYRVMLLCAGDTGFSARKTYDLEVWLPAQKCYREISSCSSCGDFQCRRIQARWRNPKNNKPELLHSLNGSGVAVGRCLIALLENHQQADGSVSIPPALQPYMGNISRLEKTVEHAT